MVNSRSDYPIDPSSSGICHDLCGADNFEQFDRRIVVAIKHSGSAVGDGTDWDAKEVGESGAASDAKKME